MEYVRAAHLVARQVRAYVNDVLPLLQETAATSLTAVLLLLRLFYHLLRPVFHLIVHIYHWSVPSLTQAFKLLYRGFAAQPPRLLAAEAALLLTLLTLLLLERKFRFYARLSALVKTSTRAVSRFYKTFHRELRQKSRTAAAALPHLVFCAAATAFHVTLARFLLPLTKGPAVVLLVCVKPAIDTVQLLYTVDEDLDYAQDSPAPTATGIPAARMEQREATGNTYETPVTRRRRPRDQDTGSVRRRVLTFDTPQERVSTSDDTPVPPSTPRRRTPARKRADQDDAEDCSARAHLEEQTLRFWVVFGVLWTARSITWYFCPVFLTSLLTSLDTALLYIFLWLQLRLTRGSNLVYSVLSGIARQRWKLQQDAPQLNVLLRLLVATGLVSAERAESLESTFTESGLALIGLIFLITPRLATFLGTVLVGLLVPCYLSMAVLERGKGDRYNWLSYWGVYSLFDGVFTAAEGAVGWVPLWYHVKMLAILWLQVPYYRGCVTVLDWCMGHVGAALSTVRQQTMTPRKRKRA